MAISRLGLTINLRRNALSQYQGYNFNSMCEWNGLYLGANEDGIFTLEDSETDNGTEILSIVETVTTNFDTDHAKRMRKAYIGYEASGNLILKIVVDDEHEHTYFLKPVKKQQLQHKTKVPLGRDLKGDYFMYRIENKNGCDFSIDSLDMVPVTLSMGR